MVAKGFSNFQPFSQQLFVFEGNRIEPFPRTIVLLQCGLKGGRGLLRTPTLTHCNYDVVMTALRAHVHKMEREFNAPFRDPRSVVWPREVGCDPSSAGKPSLR
jgi:hypothetical protein